MIKKKILPPTMALAFFDEDEDPTAVGEEDEDALFPRRPHDLAIMSSSPSSKQRGKQARPLSLHEELESFDIKLGGIQPPPPQHHHPGPRGQHGSAGSFSSGSDPELLDCLVDTTGTTPDELDTPDPFNDSVVDDEDWEWESSELDFSHFKQDSLYAINSDTHK